MSFVGSDFLSNLMSFVGQTFIVSNGPNCNLWFLLDIILFYFSLSQLAPLPTGRAGACLVVIK